MNPAVLWGLIGGFGLILVSILTYLLNVHSHSSIIFIFYGILIFSIVMGITGKKNAETESYFPFGKAFVTGIIVTAIASLIGSIYTFIFYKYIDPELMQLILEQSKQTIYDQNMSEIEENQSIRFIEFFVSPAIMAISSFIVYCIVGLIVSVIASLFVKTNPPENQEIA